MIKRIEQELETLLKTKSPTGNTKEGIDWVMTKFKQLGLDTKLTQKGGMIATLPGNEEKGIVVTAHIDTLGAMVKDITSNGRLKLTQIGGYAWSTIEGEYVEVETNDGKYYTGTILTNVASSHVHGGKTNSTVRNEETLEVRLDEKVNSKQDVLDLGINVGDYVHLDPKTTITSSGFIKSRHLDDKACVISALEIARFFVENNSKPNKTVYFYISNFEEVGHGTSAMDLDIDEMLVLDMAAVGQGQTSNEYEVTICAKDSSGPYDLDVRKKLIELAKQNDIPYCVDIYPFYGSDGSASLRAGHDVRVGLIGPGVDASHSFERTHMDAIIATIDLGIAYLK